MALFQMRRNKITCNFLTFSLLMVKIDHNNIFSWKISKYLTDHDDNTNNEFIDDFRDLSFHENLRNCVTFCYLKSFLRRFTSQKWHRN
jgi:hypothetical protein